MNLPCRHIIRLRNVKNLATFDVSLFAKRWTRSYYQSQHYALSGSSNNLPPSISLEVLDAKPTSRKKLTSTQMYREIMGISQKISEVCSLMAPNQYHQAKGCMSKLLKLFGEGKYVNVEEVQNNDGVNLG